MKKNIPDNLYRMHFCSLSNFRKNYSFFLKTALVILLITGFEYVAKADDFDIMRGKYLNTLTGGTGINLSDPFVASKVSTIGSRAYGFINNISTNPNRTQFFSDIPVPDQYGRLSTYYRLREMALGYATTGSAYEGNTRLRDSVVSGLNWMYAHCYNDTTSGPGNWFEWQIAIPQALNDCITLMYPALTPAQITNYVKGIDHFTPNITFDGGNRASQCKVILIRGIVNKNATKVNQAKNGIPGALAFATNGDEGFYPDGSFIAHQGLPYTGGYGATLLGAIPMFTYVMTGTAYAITDPNINNLYKWVFDAYKPTIYKGGMMSMVNGRYKARTKVTEHSLGIARINAMLFILQAAPTGSIGTGYPANTKVAMQQMLKYWYNMDNSGQAKEPADLFTYGLYKAFIGDAGIAPMAEPVGNFRFPQMDRVVHLRPGYGFGISMFSSRIKNFEIVTGEDKLGWHTADGMSYLYNNDLNQYDSSYWTCVNPYRMPGTTVELNTSTVQRSNSDQSWVGASSLTGGNGAAGMGLHVGNLRTLKSWFMFDDEIVCLGAGVTDPDNIGVVTYIDNRKLNSGNTNVLTVNGTSKPNTPGSGSFGVVNWAHLAGSVSGSDVGYYFPSPVTVYYERGPRTGSWNAITDEGSTAPITNNFLNMWVGHGTAPSAGAYSYVLLPNKTATETGNYNTNPDVVVLVNSQNVQAAKDNTLNVIGANFWTNTTQSVNVGTYPAYLTCNTKASVMVRQTGSELEIAASDPTQLNTGTIVVEVKSETASTIAKDGAVTVLQYSPTTKISINVNGAQGKTYRIRLATGTAKIAASPKGLFTEEKPAETLVYPNPATTGFTISYQSASNQKGEIALLDANGKTVQTEAVHFAEGANELKVGLPAKILLGTYFVRITNGTQTVTKMLVVTK